MIEPENGSPPEYGYRVLIAPMGLLDAIRRARSPFERAGSPPPPNVDLPKVRVLIVYLFEGVGDAWLLGPALAALLEAGARPPIGILAPPTAIRALRLFDLPLRFHPIVDSTDTDTRSAVQELEAKIRRRRYDIAVDLTLRKGRDSRRWLLASGAKTRLGWRTKSERADVSPLTHGILDQRGQAERHWSRYLVAPLTPLGVTSPRYDLPFRTSDTARGRAQALLGDRPRVVLVPGAKASSKQWGPDHFERIGRTIIDRFSGSVVVVGAPSEGKAIRSLTRSIGKGASAYTQKGLDVVKELIDNADAVVTSDTGPMHLSFLLHKPTISVFTSMSPVCWGPWKTDPRFVILRAPTGEDPSHMGLGHVWAKAIEGYLSRMLEDGDQ